MLAGEGRTVAVVGAGTIRWMFMAIQRIVHKILDYMRTAEQGMELTCSVDNDYDSGMIDRIRTVVPCIFFEENPQPACQFPQLVKLTRDSERSVTVCRNVFRHDRGCVALGIYADENDARQRGVSDIL